MTLLDGIRGPDEVRALTPEQCDQLAQEIRDKLVASVSKTGGHLGPEFGRGRTDDRVASRLSLTG